MTQKICTFAGHSKIYGDDTVKEHQNVVGNYGQFSVKVPFASRFFQNVKGADGRSAACPSDGKFHGHNRNAENSQKQKIKQNKNTSAVVSYHVGETPHIADTDGASGRDENEPKTAFKLFSLHDIKSFPKTAENEFCLFFLL